MTRGAALLAAENVAALVEPPVHVGLAGLVNSLVRNGFQGTVWAGHRGDLPAWADGARRTVAAGCDVRFVPLATDRPLTFYKPAFVDLLWREHCPDADSIVYFDTDIVVDVEWAFFRAWLGRGIALCEDLPHHVVGEDHPLRHAWRDLLDEFGVPARRPVGRYFNAGFVGVPRSEAETFVPVWKHVVERLDALGELQGSITPHFDRVGRAANETLPEALRAILRHGYQWDQDGLNMALMATGSRISGLGPEGMGFTPATSFVMAHAIGPHKPWNKSFWTLARRGVSYADETWWRYADGPLPAAPRSAIVRRRASLRVAKALARVLAPNR